MTRKTIENNVFACTKENRRITLYIYYMRVMIHRAKHHYRQANNSSFFSHQLAFSRAAAVPCPAG
jgi:hypothetical protein